MCSNQKALKIPSPDDRRNHGPTRIGHESFNIDTEELDPSSFSKFREIIKDNKDYEASSDQGMRNTGKYAVVYIGKVPMETWDPLIKLMKELYLVGIRTEPGKGRIMKWNKWKRWMIAYPLT